VVDLNEEETKLFFFKIIHPNPQPLELSAAISPLLINISIKIRNIFFIFYPLDLIMQEPKQRSIKYQEEISLSKKLPLLIFY
jgi:hypothetical protein